MLNNGYGNDLSAADIGAVLGNRGGFGGGDGAWWLIVIVLLAFMGNGGNRWGNVGGGFMPDVATQSDVQRGFDQSALTSNLMNMQNGTNGSFQQLTQQINQVAMAQQSSGCDTRSQIADLKYTMAVENCKDRADIAAALRELTAFVGAQTQSLKDDFCDYRIEQKDETIALLRSQINEMSRNASQTQQTLELKADNAAQTVALEQYLSPQARPAYIVPNPNCCGQYMGCGQF